VFSSKTQLFFALLAGSDATEATDDSGWRVTRLHVPITFRTIDLLVDITSTREQEQSFHQLERDPAVWRLSGTKNLIDGDTWTSRRLPRHSKQFMDRNRFMSRLTLRKQ
jgi:hypothetical protein